MAVFSILFTGVWRQAVNDQWGLTGKTTAYLPESAKLVNADRYHDQILILESNLSAQQLSWAPMGASAPSSILMFQADNPCDIRTNSPSDTTFLSGVQLLYLTGHISNIWVTTGSFAATTIRLIGAGGSAATLTTTMPLP